jgi:predicted O-methyltransferase YrrM
MNSKPAMKDLTSAPAAAGSQETSKLTPPTRDQAGDRVMGQSKGGRPPAQYSLHRLRRLGPRAILQKARRWFLYRLAFGPIEHAGLHLLPADYTSPVPDTRDLRRRRADWYRASEMPGIDLGAAQQMQLLQKLEEHNAEFPALPCHDDLVRQGIGLGFGEVEGHILYAMIRHFRPGIILEVGSGVSTYYSNRALQENRQGSIRCIEPYPLRPFETFASQEGIELLRRPAQSLDPAIFEELQENDILFIDSSHILKLGSDVWFLYLEVLPRLRPGVLVHIHDIDFPFPCPEPEEWIFRGRQFWNESALLQALLCGNSHLRILLCSSWLAHLQPDALQKAFPVYDPERHQPASIWLRTTK